MKDEVRRGHFGTEAGTRHPNNRTGAFNISRFRPLLTTALAAAVALGTPPAVGQASAPAPVLSAACATPLVVDAGALPWSSPQIDTRALGADPAGPRFPCYAKLVLPTGGQAQPSKVVWFSFTPASSDVYRIDTLGSSPADYDTILGVYTGACGTLEPVSGVCGKSGFFPDDAPGSLQSSVTLNLMAGTTYTIAVGAVGTTNAYSGLVEPPAGGALRLNVARVPVAYAYTYLIPSLTRGAGFVSDLYVTNLEATDAQFLAQYLGHGNDGDQNLPAVQPVAPPQIVSAGGTRLYADTLGLFGYATEWGAMVVHSTRRLLIGVRTWASVAGGAVGQFSAAVDVSPGLASPEALGPGETGRFVAVREDAGARTSLLFANTAASACTLRAEVRDGAGAVLGQVRTIVVPPGTAVRKDGLKSTFGIAGDLRAASVVVRNASPGCSVVGVAHVADGNAVPGTGDPYAVPLRK